MSNLVKVMTNLFNNFELTQVQSMIQDIKTMKCNSASVGANVFVVQKTKKRLEC